MKNWATAHCSLFQVKLLWQLTIQKFTGISLHQSLCKCPNPYKICKVLKPQKHRASASILANFPNPYTKYKVHQIANQVFSKSPTTVTKNGGRGEAVGRIILFRMPGWTELEDLLSPMSLTLISYLCTFCLFASS